MLKNRKVLFVVFPLLFGALLFGVVELFQLRFEAGMCIRHIRRCAQTL